MYMGWGSLPLDAVIEGLKQKKFDGFVTVEVVQQDWSTEKAFQYAQETRDAFLNRLDVVSGSGSAYPFSRSVFLIEVKPYE